MDFDPDAYLASKTKAPSAPAGGFDPDAYLASKSSSAPAPKQAEDDGSWGNGIIGKTLSGPAGVVDAGLSMAANTVGLFAGGATEIGSNLIGRSKEDSKQSGEAVQKAISRAPSTRAGADILEGLGNAADALKIPPFMPMIGTAGRTMQAANPISKAGAGVVASKVGAAIADTPEAALLKSKFGTEARTAAKATREQKVQAALAEDAPRIQTIVQSRDAGYVIPLSQTSKSHVANLAEGVESSSKIAKEASLKNQAITNKQIALDLGLKPKTPITAAAIEEVKKPYISSLEKIKGIQSSFLADKKYLQDIDALGGDRHETASRYPDILGNPIVDKIKTVLSQPEMMPKDAVVLIQNLRKDATAAFKSAATDATKLDEAHMRLDAANAIESLVERNLLKQGNKTLYDDFVSGRRMNAKAHNAEAALIEGTGDIDAGFYGKLYAKGAPLDGAAKIVGQFANTFPHSARTPRDIGPYSKVGVLDAYAGLGSLAAGHPALGALTLARPISRAAQLSETMQNKAVKPYRKLKVEE